METKIRVDDLKINRILHQKFNKEFEEFLGYKGIYDLFKYKDLVEKEFAKYIGKEFARFVDSGTTALQLALFLIGVGEDDEVIVPTVTNASTAAVVLCMGAKPVFVDIKENFTIDESQIESKITDKTKAIIPVHMFGHACDMEKIAEISEKYSIKIIEDACQAHGSLYKGKKLGSFADISTFSFDPHKNLSSMGAGGAVLFDNPDFSEKIKNASRQELGHKELISLKRFPARMSFLDIMALRVKLKYVKLIEQSKIRNKNIYQKNLEGLSSIKTVKDVSGEESVRQFYVVWAEKRDELLDYLKSEGVVCKLPEVPLNKLEVFREIDNKNYPVSEKNHLEAIYLPLFTFLKEEEAIYICDKIKEFYSKD